MTDMYPRATIKTECRLSGRCLFSNERVNVTFKPAESNQGIVFVRTDLPDSPVISLDHRHVRSHNHRTLIGSDSVYVHVTEHLLAACYLHGITDMLIELDHTELPNFDGSSRHYHDLFSSVGLEPLKGNLKPLTVKHCITLDHAGASMIIRPSNKFKITYMLSHPNEYLRDQMYSVDIRVPGSADNILPARTFITKAELEVSMTQGYICNPQIGDAVLIDESGYHPELWIYNEPARHKVLDIIGDLAILQRELFIDIVAVKTGHMMNLKLAKRLFAINPS